MPGFGDLDHGNRGALARDALNERFDGARRFLVSQKASLDHLGVVGDEEVARTKEFFNVGEVTVDEGLRRDAQKARSAPLREGILCDELFGELEIKVGKMLFPHGLTGQE